MSTWLVVFKTIGGTQSANVEFEADVVDSDTSGGFVKFGNYTGEVVDGRQVVKIVRIFASDVVSQVIDIGSVVSVVAKKRKAVKF